MVEALAASGFEVDPPVAVARTVLDTFDGRLHSAGLRLELREGPVRELVLTGSAGDPHAHLNWTGAAPRLAGDLPAGPFGTRVSTQIKERALLPVFHVASTSREARRRDRRGKPVVSVGIHEELRSGTAPDATLPGWVAEVAAVVGHPDDEQRTLGKIAKLGLDRRDDDLLGLVLDATGRSLAGRSSSPTVPLDPADDALEAFRAVLRNLVATVVENLPGTTADLDPEFLHELRVAVRRTRSVLAQGKKVLPPEIRDRYRDAFGELGAATGRARDLDVYVLGWADMIAPLNLADPSVLAPVLAELESRRQDAHLAMRRILKGATTRSVLESWQAWLDDSGVTGGKAGPIGPVVADRVAKAQATVLEVGRAITPESPGENLHDLRKDAKKLRYLLECFGSIFPTKARKAFVSQLKALQENLGDHQDAEVQVAELRELADDLRRRTDIGTDALLAVGRLTEALERRREAERDDFVQRFAAYDTKPNRQLLHDLLATVSQP